MSTQHNANTNPDDLVRYTELVAALEKVRAANLITDEEYQTMKSKFMRQIGNAVPVLFAEKIGNSIKKQLEDKK